MIKLLVIADDFTGANDTAVQFAQKGVASLVTIDRDIDIGSVDPKIAVLVVDIESRHLSGTRAADRVEKVVNRGRKAGIVNFYKKTDSTLRGNIGAELSAVVTAVDSDKLFFIPAYPKASRYTRNGFQYVGKELLHTTAFGHDVLEPMDSSFVPEIISKQSDIETVVVSHKANDLEKNLKKPGKQICIFDCESDGDLAAIGKILADSSSLSVTAGPAGFAKLLAELFDLPRNNIAVRKNKKPLLVINGSTNEVALRQVSFAEGNGIDTIVVPPNVLFSCEKSLTNEAKEIAESAIGKGAAGKNVILRTIGSRQQLDGYIASGIGDGVSRKDICTLAAENIGRLGGYVLDKGGFGNCAVFGGDTSISLVRAMGWRSVEPKEEIQPGLVMIEPVGGTCRINLITKSGGFGREDMILEIIDYIGD